MTRAPRLVATDLDGTIVRGDGTISARTVAAFDRLAHVGASYVLVTGRPRFAAQRGISPVEVVVFGDMPNDMSMLAYAGAPYAVNNAHPDVLAAVRQVIGGNDDDGVAVVLEQLFPTKS